MEWNLDLIVWVHDSYLIPNYSESQVKCKFDGSCIPRNVTCDNKYDCHDGWDESLKLCYRNCGSGQFQCGNGACINGSLVCDHKYDCLDGADELPNVCENEANYISMELRNCNLEGKPLMKFHEDTKNFVAKGVKFVLPNMPARINCGSWLKSIGQEWNVCRVNGTWAFPITKCQGKNGFY